MKKIHAIIIIALSLFCINTVAQVPVVAHAQKKPVLLSGATIHTGTGTVIENGAVAFSGGKITFVGKVSDFKGDRTSFEVIDVTGKQLYPGLIFPNTNLGLVEIDGVDVTVDNRETGDLNPNVRSIVAYNTDSHVIPVVRSNGILLAQVVPSGTLLPGTASVVQLDAWNWEDAIYKADDGLIMGWPRRSSAMGRGGVSTYPQPSASASASAGESAYDRNVEQLEKIFTDAVAYSQIEKPENWNLRLEAMKGLFDGSKILYLNASDPKGIIAAISFAKRHGVKRIVLTGADESAWAVKDFLKENNIPVILSHVHALPRYEFSDIRLPFKLAAMFIKEGILTGLTYATPAYGYNLPFAAGQTVPYGLTKEEALQTVTLNNAKILGIDDVTGSVEEGKDANIVVSAGDILDMMTNNIEYAFIAGRNISLDNKHKQLYRRFQSKYENIK
ncbi:MAG TPA: amidohydrolase family protein [Bacteroidales bacterium]|nr:amidohydrolase family protein [Bacteroidales bacterium]HPF03354.1 amidohydrolase family protein [Bacteroidales bacterium]HPJ60365.1 amidohydrolase family protein [Bacteroidales bacterium]HPR13510.1 amidohydrolase family protein [Bacteroidales bacterium]HRW85077.1 amidohydrolase family protein [Bacteroidales bacterium]